MGHTAVHEPTSAHARLAEVAYPTRSAPVIEAHRVANPGARIPLFGEDAWSLAALETHTPRGAVSLRFESWPPGFKDFAKHVAYALINHGNPPTLTEASGSSHSRWPAAGSIKLVLTHLKSLVGMLTNSSTGPSARAVRYAEQPVFEPSDLDSAHLDALRRWVEALGEADHGKNKKLEAILRVWHLSPWIPEELRWPEPTWGASNWHLRRAGEENRTERIPQEVMGPLLEWAVAFVTLFADDIFGADQHYRERRAAQTGRPAEQPRQLLDRYIREGWSLPSDALYPGRVGWQAVAYANERPVDGLAATYWRSYRGRIPIDPAFGELDFEPSAMFHGVRWITAFRVADVTPQVGLKADYGVMLFHLRTACLIVCAYLTGARPDEVLGLRHGAARDPIDRPDGSQLFLIDGHVSKGIRRGSNGAPGSPIPATWATIPVAALALKVAERVSRIMGRAEGRLFETDAGLSNPAVANGWVAKFVGFVNERLAPNSADPAALSIPVTDSHLTLRRFRRTLAWFITNRPGGEVTTAIQYQHVSDRLTSGYAGTKESGMRDLLLEEDWRHRRRTIENVAHLIDSGRQLTGPGAARATTIALGMPRFLTPADEKRLRKDRDLVIYDNPAALALCVWDETRALCRKRELGSSSAPSLPSCVDGCPNIARTDAHIEKLDAESLMLRTSAAMSPKPIAQSLVARAERNEKIVANARAQTKANVDD